MGANHFNPRINIRRILGIRYKTFTFDLTFLNAHRVFLFKFVNPQTMNIHGNVNNSSFTLSLST